MWGFLAGYMIGSSDSNQKSDDSGITFSRIIGALLHVYVLFVLILLPFGFIGYEIGQTIADIKIVKWSFAFVIAIVASGLYFTIDDYFMKYNGSEFKRIFLIIGLGIFYYVAIKIIISLFYANIDKNILIGVISITNNAIESIFSWMLSK